MGLKSGRPIAGFYASGSHEIVDYSDCLVQPELSVQLTLKVKELARDLGWSIYNEKKHSGWLRHILIRTNQSGQASLALVTRNPHFPQESRFVREIRSSFPQLVSLFQNIQTLKTSVVLGPYWRKLWGQERLEERLGPFRLRLSPGAFLQINTPACQILYDVVKGFLSPMNTRPQLILDLYCGIGGVALWIANCADKILGIEENQQAVEDAWFNARLNGVRNVRFKAGLVETLRKYLYKELDGVERGRAAAVLDPPRSGLGEAALPIFKAPSLSRLVYVSCNPATLARDIARLASYGWRLTRIQPVDLFPQTSHVESVALLERG
jgi:23S rRNA (uracil1939-C5)-methyltransferase